MMVATIILAVVCLAYANGANDNFKGVATLFGSGTTNYRGALTWATSSTIVGSATAIVLAEQLLKNFSGRGLVPDELAATTQYGAAVALAAGLTVLIATRIGMPISTTHALVGSLVGAGWSAGAAVHLEKLGSSFFLPLLASPFIALAVICFVYPALHWVRQCMGVTRETCFCVGAQVVETVPAMSHAASLAYAQQLSVTIGSTVCCHQRYNGRVLGLSAATALDWAHYMSAGVVSFARGLNDTPKIAALLLLAPGLGSIGSIAVVGLCITVGGLLSARKVAETMSQKITPMNHGQGFAANLVTGIIVIVASRFGLPVSTTHVSCGSLFGIGLTTRQGQIGTILRILLAWVTTLPAGVLLGFTCYRIINLV